MFITKKIYFKTTLKFDFANTKSNATLLLTWLPALKQSSCTLAFVLLFCSSAPECLSICFWNLNTSSWWLLVALQSLSADKSIQHLLQWKSKSLFSALWIFAKLQPFTLHSCLPGISLRYFQRQGEKTWGKKAIKGVKKCNEHLGIFLSI